MSSDEIPEWLVDMAEPEPEPAGKPPARPKPGSKPRPAATNRPLTSLQLAILAALGLVLCAILAGIGGLVYVYRPLLFGPAPRPVAVASPLPVGDAPPTATPAPTATFTPIPTFALPEPEATPEPSPTATYAVAPAFINKDKIQEISVFVEKWRQLSLPEPLPIEFLTRSQLHDRFAEQAYDQATLEAIQTQQEFYRALGLIEPGVDLAEAALSGQTDSLLGYYTPQEKVMYIIAESVNMFAEEEMTFAHEYVHALQDHHFDLDAFLDENQSADAQLAARSLPEGDARLVQDLFTQENITQDQIDYTVYRYLFREHPQLEGVSPALGIFTYFPYTAGEYFVVYLFVEGNFSWDKVNQAYHNPPVSSEQVMHPEKYLAGEKPVVVALPDLAPALGDAWQEIDRDVLGEAGLLVWLIDRVEDSVAIAGAAGWDGDAYTLWVDNANRRVLAELSIWETDTEAAEFATAFTAYMDSREAGAVRSTEPGVQIWEYETGATVVSRRGQWVLVAVAPDRLVLDSVRAQFNGF